MIGDTESIVYVTHYKHTIEINGFYYSYLSQKKKRPKSFALAVVSCAVVSCTRDLGLDTQVLQPLYENG